MSSLLDSCNKSMEKKTEMLEKEFSRLRTGRASASILEGIRVDYYGVNTPLNQVASISVPDARTILISPFDKKLLVGIEKAIQIADIGIQPNNDGNVIRLPVPALNEDRRKEISKSIRKLGEDAKVAIRLVRKDVNNKSKKMEKGKELNEDELRTLTKEIQEMTDKYTKNIDTLTSKKEKEVMSF
jgi:ribosome recycling factor